MAYQIIPITQRPDGSLSVDLRNIRIRQGDYDLYQLSYLSNKDYTNVEPMVDIQVAFRRRDGQQTGWIPLTKSSGKQYYLNLKSRWFTNIAGNLYITIRAKQTSSSNVELILNTSSATIPIEPIAQFNPIEDILPSEFDIYKEEVQEKFDNINVSLSELNSNKLDKNFKDYQPLNLNELDGLEKIISNDVFGSPKTVLLSEVINKVNTVNGIVADNNKNITISASNINTVYGNTIDEEFSSINGKLDRAVYTDGNNDLFDSSNVKIIPRTEAVYVKTTKSNVQEQLDEIIDEIKYVGLFKGVYATEQELLASYPNGNIYEQGIWVIILETDTVWIYDNDTLKWKDTGKVVAELFSVNGKFPDETGNILITGSDITSTVGLNGDAVTETITQHIQNLYNQAKSLQTSLTLETQNRTTADTNIGTRIDNTNTRIDGIDTKIKSIEDDIKDIQSDIPTDYVDLGTDQSIVGQKTFEKPIKLSSGTNIDTISNTSDGVSIDSSSGKNLLNINETLETISSFNKTLAFDEDVPTKTSDITNDGDGDSPFATQQYVEQNGGKIDVIKVDDVIQNITNKEVNIQLANRFNSKVDKITTSGNKRVYGIDESGNQTTYNVSIGTVNSNIVQRQSTGQISVPDAPSSETDATSKKYVDNAVASISGQNNYVGSYDGTTYTASTIQSELNSFVQSIEGRAPRNGDLVNIVNSGDGVDYKGQQWIYDGTNQIWKYYITFESHDVIDNLTSTSVNDGLSANQGRVLKGLIDGLQSDLNNVDLKVDDIVLPTKTSELINDGSDGQNPYITDETNSLTNYYTDDEIDTMLDEYLLKSGIVNSLTSTATDQALSANQGKVLDEKITSTNNNINTTNQNVTNLTNRVDDAEDDIATNMADIASHTQSISTLNSNVSSLQSSVSGITERVSTVETEINRVEGLIPTTTSQLTNNSGFITNTVNNLTNYYTKTNLYTKDEVDQLISGISSFKATIVQTLPSTGTANTIYLVPKTTSAEQNTYDEYMWINNAWENIGATTVDLSDYYTKAQTYSRTEINNFLNAKASQSSLDTTNTNLTNLTSRVSTIESNYYPKSGGLLSGSPIIPYAGNGLLAPRNATGTQTTGLVRWDESTTGIIFGDGGTTQPTTTLNYRFVGDGDIKHYYSTARISATVLDTKNFTDHFNYLPISGGTVTGPVSFTGTVGNTQTEAGVYLGLDTNTGAENANMAIVSANTASYIDMGRPNVDYDFRIIKWSGMNDNNAQFSYGGNASGTITIPQRTGVMALTSDIPKLVTLTQAEYDALATKDANTYYFIKEE